MQNFLCFADSTINHKNKISNPPPFHMANIFLIPLKLLTDLGTFQQKLIGTFFKKKSPFAVVKKKQKTTCQSRNVTLNTPHRFLFACLFVNALWTPSCQSLCLSTQLLIKNPRTSKSNFLTFLISNSQSTKCQSKP